MLENAERLAVIAGFIVAASSLGITAYQVHLGRLAAEATLWLELRRMFAEHQDAHVKLRPGGAWYNKGNAPSLPELPQVEAYLGLFEHCRIMLDKGLLDLGTFKRIYAYRIDNILNNPVIVCEKLVKRREGWEDFVALAEKMGGTVPTRC